MHSVAAILFGCHIEGRPTDILLGGTLFGGAVQGAVQGVVGGCCLDFKQPHAGNSITTIGSFDTLHSWESTPLLCYADPFCSLDTDHHSKAMPFGNDHHNTETIRARQAKAAIEAFWVDDGKRNELEQRIVAAGSGTSGCLANFYLNFVSFT